MKRSAVDIFLVAALAVGATALFGLIRGLPSSCPSPNSSSVEALFAPCLANDGQDLRRTADSQFFLPAPAVRPGATIAIGPETQSGDLDVDVTGSVRSR